MLFILRLKHWQAFLLTGPLFPLAFISHLVLYSLGFGEWAVSVRGGLMAAWAAGLILYLLGTGIALFGLSRNRGIFILIVFITAGIFSLSYMSTFHVLTTGMRIKPFVPEGIGAAVIVPLHLAAMTANFGMMIFNARLLGDLEAKGRAKTAEYVLNFLLFCFTPGGVWILQPRLNALVASMERSAASDS